MSPPDVMSMSMADMAKLIQKQQEQKAYINRATMRYRLERLAREQGITVKEVIENAANRKGGGRRMAYTWEDYVHDTNKAFDNHRGKAARERKGITEKLEV